MAVNWSLAAQPINPLQALQAFGMAQQQQQQAAQAEQERVQRDREFALRERQAGFQERKFTAEQQNEALGKISQAAQDVLRRPEAERGAVWDSYMDQFAQSDPSAAQFKGQYSEQALRSILAKTGDLEKFNKSGEVDYQVIPQGGRLQGFQFGRPLGMGGEQAAPTGGGQPQQSDGGNVIDARGAAIMKKSLGEAGYRKWLAKNGITEMGGGQAVQPPAGFVLDQ